jgi:hypothetical protein
MTDAHLDAVSPDLLYPMTILEKITGLGRAALRSARRSGLRVYYVHGRSFIHGRDWIEYVKTHGKGSKDGP